MNIDNITSDSMTLTYNGKAILIKVYEQEIERLNNIINELENILKDLIFGSNNLNHRLTAQIILMRLKELKGSDKE